MINKKIAASVLLLASLGLVACGGSGSTSETTVPPSTSSSEGGDPVIPVADGKYTVYFHFAATDAVASISSWNSAFITGAFNGWTTGLGGDTPAAEFTNIADSDIYYTQIADADVAKGVGFQITLGYNKSSGLPDSMCGVNWGYKSTLGNIFPGTAHPLWTADAETKLIHIVSADQVVQKEGVTGDEAYDLDPATLHDYVGFMGQPGKPTLKETFDLTMTLADSVGDVPSYVDFYIKGSFDGWTGTLDAAHKLVKGDDNKYHLQITNVVVNSKYEYMIGAMTSNDTAFNEAYRLCASNVDTAADGYAWENPSFTVYSDDTGYTLPEQVLWGLNAKAGWPEDPALSKKINVTITLNNTDATAYTGAVPSVAGGWGEGNWVPGKNPMTVVTEGKVWSYEIADLVVGSTLEFKIVPSTEGNWNGLQNAEGGNLTAVLEEAKLHINVSGSLTTFGTTASTGTLEYVA